MSNGIGSGLDVNGIVDGLMAIQKRDLLRLDKKKSLLQNQQTAYHKVRDLIKNFTKNIDNLGSILNNNIFKVQSSDEAAISVLLNSQKPSAGNYTIVVNQLAQAHQIGSDAYGNEDQPLQIQGDLAITAGTNRFTLNITQTDTLDSIRDHINNSFNNNAISASILKTTNALGQDEYRLLLTSNNTGAANKIILEGSALGSIHFATEFKSAQDSDFTINNFHVTRNSNVVSDVLSGVTFQLNSAQSSSNISVSSDTNNEQSLITGALQTMVESYNNLIDYVSKNQSVSSLRDGTYSLIKLNLKNTMAEAIGNNTLNSLLNIGIKLAASEKKTNEEGVEYAVEGKLMIDNNILQDNVQNHLAELRAFFTGKGANFINSLKTMINGIETQNIFNRERLISKETTYVDHRINREESRLDALKMNLTIKYAALDSYLSRYKQMSDFLNQQISMLNPVGKK